MSAGASKASQLGSVGKAIDVLFHLQAMPDAQGVTAIGRALGLPKTSAHRLLGALCRRGLVERDDRVVQDAGELIVSAWSGDHIVRPATDPITGGRNANCLHIGSTSTS